MGLSAAGPGCTPAREGALPADAGTAAACSATAEATAGGGDAACVPQPITVAARPAQAGGSHRLSESIPASIKPNLRHELQTRAGASKVAAVIFERRKDLERRLVFPLRVKPGSKVELPHGFDPAHTAHFVDREDAEEALQQGVVRLAELQDKLAAQRTYGLLVVLQAMDAAGKDGAIKHVMSGVNPQGVFVRSFKVPSDEELHHDYLWRYQSSLPQRGQITIFNRSYYEECLVVRVHPELLQRQALPPEAADGIWKHRFEEINNWERYLVRNGIHVVKLFLNVSKEEQRRRLLARIDDEDKNWKYSAADAHEREFWGDYQHAFSEVLTHTSTEWAPWYVIPADHKWFARLSVAGVLIDALDEIDPTYPVVSEEQKAALQQAKSTLV